MVISNAAVPFDAVMAPLVVDPAQVPIVGAVADAREKFAPKILKAREEGTDASDSE